MTIKIPKYVNPKNVKNSASIIPYGLQTSKLSPAERADAIAKQLKRDPKSADQLIEYLKTGKGRSYAKGGKIKKTGIYKLHKGEIVMNKKQQKKLKKKKIKK